MRTSWISTGVLAEPIANGSAPGARTAASFPASRWILGALFLAGASAGCTASHERTPCGPTTCDFGWVCCNPSCGICTTPGGSCIELACLPEGGAPDGDFLRDSSVPFHPDSSIGLDAGWNCGGRGGFDCPPGDYCDFPDGSFCGGDDSFGRCLRRPDDCPEPGGVPVCGCDGNDYLTECSANFSGVDVAHFGSCTTTTPSSVAGWRECGPADGPAWRLEFSLERRPSCDVRAAGGTAVVQVFSDLEGFTGPISLDGSFTTGAVSVCEGPPGAPCIGARGTLFVDFFAAGEIGRFDLELVLDDGRSFSVTDAELTSFWCGLSFPGCG